MSFKLEMVVLRSKAPSASATTFDLDVDDEMVAGYTASGERRLDDVEVHVDELDADGCTRAKKDPTVLSLAPRMPVTLISAMEETSVAEAAAQKCWGIEAVKADKSQYNGEGVTVAVLDTGIDATHPAFAGIEIIKENFTDEAPEDLHGHGTHCAGTIFGRDFDGCRIGVANGVKRVLIGKVLGAGGGSSEQIVKAIQWAQYKGADIISMSLGMDFPGYQQQLVDRYGLDPKQATSLALAGYRLNTRLFDQLSRSMANNDGLLTGTVVTAAAGNESNRPNYSIIVAPPAAGEMFVSVAALGFDGPGKYHVAAFSNEGATLCAPGEGIVSAKKGGGLAKMSGTSMATPHVAGVAALWAQKLKQDEQQSSAGRVIEVLKSKTLNLGASFQRNDIGLGLVQAP